MSDDIAKILQDARERNAEITRQSREHIERVAELQTRVIFWSSMGKTPPHIKQAVNEMLLTERRYEPNGTSHQDT